MFTIFLALALALVIDAAAQTHVYRCQDANGHWVFQGRQCGDGLTSVDTPATEPLRSSPSLRDSSIPTRCESPPQRFTFADPALDGAELSLVMSRDASGYQVVFNLGGVIEHDDGPVPIQFSERLSAQGLRFDEGELIAPDFRRGDKQLGYGYARSAILLERATSALTIDTELEPRGYSQSLLSAPIAASVLPALRSDLLRCHLLRERVRMAMAAEPEQ